MVVERAMALLRKWFDAKRREGVTHEKPKWKEILKDVTKAEREQWGDRFAEDVEKYLDDRRKAREDTRGWNKKRKRDRVDGKFIR